MEKLSEMFPGTGEADREKGKKRFREEVLWSLIEGPVQTMQFKKLSTFIIAMSNACNELRTKRKIQELEYSGIIKLLEEIEAKYKANSNIDIATIIDHKEFATYIEGIIQKDRDRKLDPDSTL